MQVKMLTRIYCAMVGCFTKLSAISGVKFSVVDTIKVKGNGKSSYTNNYDSWS